MADIDNSPELQYAAEPSKKAEKEKKEEKVQKEPLPLLVEFTITVCAIILVVTFFTITGVSLLTGKNLLAFVLRTSISTLVIGGLLTLIARQVMKGMFASGAPVEEKSKTGDQEPQELWNSPEVK